MQPDTKIDTQIPAVENAQMGALLATVERITRIIKRGQVYELVYTAENTPKDAMDNLQKALVDMYKAVLELLASSQVLFSEHTPVRVFHAILKPGETVEQFSDLVKSESNLSFEVQACESGRSAGIDACLLELLHNLDAPLTRIDEGVGELLEHVQASEKIELLDWISGTLYGDHHLKVKENRVSDTCHWLLEHPDFREWEDVSSSVFLWLQGTGKILNLLKVRPVFYSDYLLRYINM